jgi:hypothetical protein
MQQIIMNVEVKERLKIRDKFAEMDILQIMEHYIQARMKVSTDQALKKHLDLEEG